MTLLLVRLDFVFPTRSHTDENCLYSAISLQISGDNSLVDNLRFLTSWVLYHTAYFYANHPIIDKIFKTHHEIFIRKPEIYQFSFPIKHLELSTRISADRGQNSINVQQMVTIFMCTSIKHCHSM